MFLLSYYKTACCSFGIFVLKLLALKYKHKYIFNNCITPRNLGKNLHCCFLGHDILFCATQHLFTTQQATMLIFTTVQTLASYKSTRWFKYDRD